MHNLQGQQAVVVGGNRGLGLAMVESLVARGVRVTVVGRDERRLKEVSSRLGVEVVRGDATDEALARNVIGQVRPTLLLVNAAALPGLAPIHEQSWEGFSRTWNNDVKATFHWLQQALRLPLAKGSRVLLSSSGAALNGSPLSGGYAGAKRMIWLMAQYASGLSKELALGITVQVLVPRQMIAETEHGRVAAEAYAQRKGVSVSEFLAGFGAPMSPKQVGEHVATLLSDAKYDQGIAYAVKGDTGIVALDG
ncbi:MAG TPA: SDR family oxidoreductase [Polyangiaceae bacterium]|nr:SDR family oxidoreductase [Polyangiaceae bacterium]